MKKVLLITMIFLASFYSQSFAYPSIPWNTTGINFVTDDSAEYKLDFIGELDQDGNVINSDDLADPTKYRFNNDQTVDKYDRFRGAFEIDSVSDGNDQADLKSSAWEIEFTGIFDIMVTSKVFTGLTGVVPGSGDSVNIYDFTFGTTPIYEAFTGINGAMLTMYIDDYGDGDDFDRTIASSDPEDVMTTASNGDEYWTFGYTGANGLAALGEGWITRGADLLSIFKDFGTGTEFGEVNFALRLIDNQLGPELREIESPIFGGTADIVGSAGLKGIQNQTTPMQVFDNLDAQIAPIPEPATMLLFGLGLLGLAGASRKRLS
ncbi:MAG: PEP-CTERM sorting domain-containing protein [Desulfobacula sp.]|nr:PEP-CTERM sorting domain-containing protein [Desulfobacula sp.]